MIRSQRRPSILRPTAAAILLLHLLVAGLLPLADAGAEGRALVAVEHVSGAGDADCQAAHHDAFCQVLNATREPFVAAVSAAHLAAAAPHAVFEIPVRSGLSPSAVQAAAPGARAPPLG